MAKKSGTRRGAGGGSGAGSMGPETRLALFHGDEHYLATAYTEELRRALEGAFGEVEVVRFDGASASVAQVLDECRSFGLMTTHKMVVVDNAAAWLSESGDDGDGGDEGDGDAEDDDGGGDGDEAVGSGSDEGDADGAGGSAEEDTATMALFGGGGGSEGAGGKGGERGGGSGGGSAAGGVSVVSTKKGGSRPRRALGKRELVLRYAAEPVESATLVVRGKGLMPGKLEQAFSERGVVIKCSTPTESAAVTAVARRMRDRHGRVLTAEAAEALVERVGLDVGRLVQEVDKLAIGVEGDGAIDESDVARMVGLTREQQNWEMKKALLSGDAERAIGLLHELLTVSRVPVQLVRWNFLDLAKALYALAESAAGKGAGVSARGLRLWGEEERRAMAIVRGASLARIRGVLEASVEADHRAKTGRGNEIRALELLAVEFASLSR
ncbi:MAG: DNA polymerase III subunit delta [Phycisphaerales bacterium]